MTAVRDRLRDDPLPGEAEAAARSWPLVEAALAEREPGRGPRGATPRRLALRLALATALLGVGLAAALTPAGGAVGDWIGDHFASEPKRAAPAFAGLPKGGSVLAITRTGAYAIRPDGGSRRLGSFSDAGWSPHGLHVVGANGRRLTAVTPRETLKWTLARPGHVHDPAWSTGLGYQVAYLEGATLRAVDGKGIPDPDRPLRRGASGVTPAWRPRSDRVLTYATAGGHIETLDVVTGRSLWRAPVEALSLQWSVDGRRIVALRSRSVVVLDSGGRILRSIELPGAGRELALHPSGKRATVLLGGEGGGRVLDVPLDGRRPRQLFQGNVDGLAWSQDGRQLLLAWRGADQWLLLGPGERVRALQDVTRELGTAGGFPRVAGWCCAR